jgi:hypothetical protein
MAVALDAGRPEEYPQGFALAQDVSECEGVVRGKIADLCPFIRPNVRQARSEALVYAIK